MTGIYFRFPGAPASPFQSHALSPADGHLFSINLPAPLFFSLSSSISTVTSLSALSLQAVRAADNPVDIASGKRRRLEWHSSVAPTSDSEGG